MLRPFFALVLFFALTSAAAFAAPLSLKELDLLVRMRVPEQEIIRDLEQRRLMAPLDAVSEQQLIKNGASAALLQHLKSGRYAISGQEAAAVQQRQADRQALLAEERAADTEAFAAREQQRQQIAEPVADTMRRMLEGKLVRLENGDLRSYSADELRHVRYYALYYSAYWCGPCRKFTPQLIDFYKRFKAQHPDFEVIFVSSDYNPASMQTYMQRAGMPWPAVKFEQIDKPLRSMAGSGIPWLGIYNAAGEPVSSNGTTKQWADPGLILRAFEQATAQPQSAAR